MRYAIKPGPDSEDGAIRKSLTTFMLVEWAQTPSIPWMGDPEESTNLIAEDKASRDAQARNKAPSKPTIEAEKQTSSEPAPEIQEKSRINPTALLENRRLEYGEVNNNIRHYSSLRFAIITVFFAATGGIASVAFGLFGLKVKIRRV